MSSASTYHRPPRILSHAIIAAGLLLPLCACSGDDAPEGPATVGIRAANAEAPSRSASPITGDDYRVWASTIYRPEGTASPYYFFESADAKEFTYDASAGAYYAHSYFYPLTGTMDFMAYASNIHSGLVPKVSHQLTTGNTSGTYSKMAIDMRQADGTYEVMYADRVTGVECSSHVTEPTLHFHHPHANLRFKFTAIDRPTCDHIVINYVLIENVAVKGLYTADLTGAVPAPTSGSDVAIGAAAYGWSYTTLENVSVASLANKTIDFDNGLDAGNGLYIVPRAHRSRIIVNYTMLNADAIDGNIGSSNHRVLNYVVNDDYTQGWNASTQYTYNIIVRADYQMEFRDIEVQLVSDGHTGHMYI